MVHQTQIHVQSIWSIRSNLHPRRVRDTDKEISKTLTDFINLKEDTAMDMNNFYNRIKISLNTVTKLREHMLPTYQVIYKT